MIDKKLKWFDCKYCGKDFQSFDKRKYCDDCTARQAKYPFPKSSSLMRMVRNREFVENYKKNKKCELCGFNNPPDILEFHHKDKKDKGTGVNILMKTLKSINEMQKEIEKCLLLCPNCHRRLHFQERLVQDEE